MITKDDTQQQRGRSIAMPSYRLVELDVFCTLFGVDRRAGMAFFKSMDIPLLHIGGGAFYSEFTLERAIYTVTRAGGSGFAAPGSSVKQHGTKLPVKFDDKLKKIFKDPSIMIEMSAANSRGLPGTLRAMATIRKKKKV